MSTRQRLRRYLDLQAATGVCWRCNLKRQQRYFSTVQDSQTGLTLEAETRMQTHLSIFGVAREGAVPPRKRDTLAESAVPVCKIGPEPELVLRKDSDGSGHGNSSLPSNIEERARPPLQTWKHHDSESPLEPGTHSAVALSTTRRCAKLSAHPLLESVQTTRMMMSESGSLRAMLLRRSAKLTGRPWLDSVQITRIKMNLPGSLSAVELIRRRRLAKLSRRPWLESVQITRMKISKQAQFDRALIASRKQAEAHISDAVPASPPPLSDALQSKPSLSLDSMRTSPLHQILPHFGERTLSKSRVGVDFFRLQKRTYISSSVGKLALPDEGVLLTLASSSRLRQRPTYPLMSQSLYLTSRLRSKLLGIFVKDCGFGRCNKTNLGNLNPRGLVSTMWVNQALCKTLSHVDKRVIESSRLRKWKTKLITLRLLYLM